MISFRWKYTCVLVFVFSCVKAQDTNKCLQDLMVVFESVNGKIENSKPGKAFRMKMTSEVNCTNGETISRTNIISATKNKSYMKGKQLEVFQDENTNVMVMHRSKEILLTHKQSNEQNTVFEKEMKRTLDSLLVHVGKVQCTNVLTIDGKAGIQVSLSPKEELVSRLKSKNVTIIYEKESLLMREYSNEYPAGGQFKSATLRFDQIEFNYSGKEMKQSAYQQVFKSNALKEVYSGYEVRDTRGKQ